MRYTIDIEDALQARLNADGIKACAPPVPADLAAPMVVCYRVGGRERAFIQDIHNMSLDVYASTEGEAMVAANRLAGYLRDLPGTKVGTTCYTVDITTLPYLNPDPSHPTLPRCTIAADIATRMATE